MNGGQPHLLASVVARASAVQFNELQSLRYHWGEAYSLDLDNGEFVAARRDNGRELRAKTAAELRVLILADYSENKVSRGVDE